MTETCEGRPPLLDNAQNWRDERGKDLTLEREKQAALTALDQKEQRVAVFNFFDGGYVSLCEFKRLTLFSAGRFYRFEHIRAYSSFKAHSAARAIGYSHCSYLPYWTKVQYTDFANFGIKALRQKSIKEDTWCEVAVALPISIFVSGKIGAVESVE